MDAGNPRTLECDLALLSDLGNERDNNEDSCGSWVEHSKHVVFAVADGVGGYEGGEVASRMAIDTLLDGYRSSPVAWGPAKRLARAAQRANIAIHDRALIVTELRRMATTLTAASIEDGVLRAIHIGDCRLYLIRGGTMRQLSKDHSATSMRTPLSVLNKEMLREYPERGALTRCLGADLIAALDRIATPLEHGDAVLIASDGLHDTLSEAQMLELIGERDAATACRLLIDRANERGTHDNLTVALFRQTSPVPERARGLRARLEGLLDGLGRK
ncbi:MAG TPA: protein phosphatase 2C domain-containing protein [Polyangiales bacterium]|nr:protein phosphatase 2C domain-containing protein [Polyangiales bacterium]